MNKKFYYHKKNREFFDKMELDKKGYPIWKDSNTELRGRRKRRR